MSILGLDQRQRINYLSKIEDVDHRAALEAPVYIHYDGEDYLVLSFCPTTRWFNVRWFITETNKFTNMENNVSFDEALKQYIAILEK